MTLPPTATALVLARDHAAPLYSGDRDPIGQAIAALTPAPYVADLHAHEMPRGHWPSPMAAVLDRLQGDVRVWFGTDDQAANLTRNGDGWTLRLTRAGLLDQYRAICALVDQAVSRCQWGSTWGCKSPHGPNNVCTGPVCEVEIPGGPVLFDACIQDFHADPRTGAPEHKPQLTVQMYAEAIDDGGFFELDDPAAIRELADRMDVFTAHLRNAAVAIEASKAAR